MVNTEHFHLEDLGRIPIEIYKWLVVSPSYDDETAYFSVHWKTRKLSTAPKTKGHFERKFQMEGRIAHQLLLRQRDYVS